MKIKKDINKKYYFNVLIKGKGKVKDKVIKFEGKCDVYDNGSIVVDGENKDFIIIGVSDKRRVFMKEVGGNYSVI